MFLLQVNCRNPSSNPAPAPGLPKKRNCRGLCDGPASACDITTITIITTITTMVMTTWTRRGNQNGSIGACHTSNTIVIDNSNNVNLDSITYNDSIGTLHTSNTTIVLNSNNLNIDSFPHNDITEAAYVPETIRRFNLIHSMSELAVLF
jgi:hypothetical protein